MMKSRLLSDKTTSKLLAIECAALGEVKVEVEED
jgi:hypothetical protein